MKYERRHSTSSGPSMGQRRSDTRGTGRGSSRSPCEENRSSPLARGARTPTLNGYSTDVDVGYFPQYEEPKATAWEWLGLVVAFVILWSLIYLMVAAFTGWWPF